MDLNSILNTGIDPTTGKYLSPEERKEAFRKSMGMGYASATKKESIRPRIKPESGLILRDQLVEDKTKKESALVKQEDNKFISKLDLLTKLANQLFQMRSERVRLEEKYAETRKKVEEREKKKSEEQSMESSGTKFGSKFLSKKANKAAKTVGFGLFNLLKGILAYGILDWISKPENKETVEMMVKGLMGVFKVFSFFVSTAVNATLGGFTKLFGGGSILERIFGFFEMIGGIFLFRRVLNPFKLLYDLKWVLDNLGNFKDIFKALRGKNLAKAGDSVKKLFPKAASIFKKGIQGAVQRIFLKVFGKGITNFIKPIAKTVIKTVVRPLAGVIKRVPVIGTLLAIPINMFLGDPIDKAVVKAIGATLGTFVVGALGSIIPGAGTVLGGIAGGLLGDWLAGWLYDGVIAPLGKTIQKSTPQLNTGGIASGPDEGYKVTLHGTEAVIPIDKLSSTILEPYKTVASAVIGGTLAVLKSMGPIGSLMGPIALQMFNPFIRLFGFTVTTFASGLGKGSELLIPSAEAKEFPDVPASKEEMVEKTKRGGGNNKTGDPTDKPSDTDQAPSGPSSYEATTWKKDPEFANAVNDVAKHFNIRSNDLLGLMASESGLNPKANNGTHVGLIQFSASSARGAGTSQSALLKMTRAQQMPYVQKYLQNAGLPKGATAGHLYTAVFLPAFVKKPADFVIANKSGTLPSGYPESKSWYSSNRGLDMNNDGKLTIAELGQRIQKKKKEFGIPMAKGGYIEMDGGGEYNLDGTPKDPRRKRKNKNNMGMKPRFASGGILSKLGDGTKLATAPRGYCTTGVLETMQVNGVANPPGTGNDGNNPRGLMVQAIKNYGWGSLPYGKPINLNSPYGKVGANMMNFAEWKSAVKSGNIPSGALVFSTRNPNWNSNGPSSGHDSAIAKKGGQKLWSGHWQTEVDGVGAVYGAGTRAIVALTPGGSNVKYDPTRAGDDADTSSTPSDSPAASDDKKEEKVNPGFMGSGASIEQLKYLMANLGMKGTGGGSSSAPPKPSAPPPSSSLPSMSSNFTLDKKMSAITSNISETVIVQQGSNTVSNITVAPLSINNFGISNTDVLSKL